MGRYYNGDINGKFWFAVQSSDDAEQFGASASESGYIPYSATELCPIKSRLCQIFDELQEPPVFWDIESSDKDETEFYAAYSKYREEHEDSGDKLWAALDIGLRLYHVVKAEGYCYFEAEL